MDNRKSGLLGRVLDHQIRTAPIDDNRHAHRLCVVEGEDTLDQQSASSLTIAFEQRTGFRPSVENVGGIDE